MVAPLVTRFDFQLVHHAGKKSSKPDALSRRADRKQGKSNNRDQVLLPPDLFHAARATRGGVVLEVFDQALMNRVKNCGEQNKAVVKVFKELGATRGALHGAEWVEEDGVVLFNGNVYIPKDGQL